MTHTPGPWHSAQGYTKGAKKRLPYVSVWAGNDCIQVHGGNPITKVDNARLIAAAPELLEALKDALETIKYYDENYDTRCSYVDGLAIIAKAEGK